MARPERSLHEHRIEIRPARRFAPIDFFALLNLALFGLMCVFTYYARFVAYRGAANVWEFFVYAAVLTIGILLLWRFFRGYALPTTLLTLIQVGICAHFAGAFVQWDHARLYDLALFGIRYDKVVHFTNAFIAVRVVRHIAERHGMKLDGLTRFFIAMTVLGLGAVVEIVEYLVVRTVPGNGVGGYDNNMQDLAANLAGTVVSIVAAGTARIRAVAPAPAGRSWIDPRDERVVSLVEIVVLAGAALAALWVLPEVLPPFAFAVLDVLLIAIAVVYAAWISPVLVHGDHPAARGLGSRSTWFIRRDNLAASSRAFGLLGLGGTIVLLLLAEWLNPGWLGRADWRSWLVRLLFYLLSASVQAMVFVAFLLVRVTRLVAGTVPGSSMRTSDRVMIALASAGLFAALHAPDPRVIALTFGFAFAAAWISLKTPNVVPAALCHAALGLLVHRALEITLRVGYFNSHPGTYVFREAFPAVRRLVEGLW